VPLLDPNLLLLLPPIIRELFVLTESSDLSEFIEALSSSSSSSTTRSLDLKFQQIYMSIWVWPKAPDLRLRVQSQPKQVIFYPGLQLNQQGILSQYNINPLQL